MDPKDEIKQKIDIVELIGEYLPLKPAGTHGFKANCPFHSEKTPSFHVSPDRQIWHCFGCGEGGDCFSFVMKMEGMDFPEALIRLGQKTGVEIKRLPTTESNVKQRMFDITGLAVKFYRKILTESAQAEQTRKYVTSRGITQDLEEKFALGWATTDWNALTQFLFKRGYSESEIVSAGLGQSKRTGSGLIDRFRGRLMIPLRDQHGNAVGFTGRVLPGTNENGPKYMNSPETPIYHKSQLLFGLDLTKRAIKEKGQVIIVEGNLDVIASHKAGVENVVASSGTALTQDQLQLLGRYTKTAVFSFDQDAAGFLAAKRGITIARGLGFDVRAIIMPEGFKDPDELVQKDPQKWLSIANASVPIMQYLISKVMAGKNMANIDDKRAVAKELIPAIQEIQDIVEQEHWINDVANLLGLEPGQLRQKVQEKQAAPTTAKLDTKVVQPAVITPMSKEERSLRFLLGLAVNDPNACTELFSDLAIDDNFEKKLVELYNLAKNLYTTACNAPNKSLFSRLRDHIDSEQREDLKRLLIELSFSADQQISQSPQQEVQKQIKILISTLRQGTAHSKRKSIAAQLRQAERANDKEAVSRLLNELNKLK